MRWLQRQLSGQELLEIRSTRILNGERGRMSAVLFTNGQRAPVARLMYCFPKFSLLTNSVVARHPHSPYAAQDTKTGLGNRLFFDNQLATLLEDQEKWECMAW